MLNASSITLNKDKFKGCRRRTWCTTTYEGNNENIDDTLPHSGLSNAPNIQPQKSQISRFKNFLTPQVYNGDAPKKSLSPTCESLPSLEDIEFPDQNFTITSPTTPTTASVCKECMKSKKLPVRVSLTPIGTRER